MENRFNMLIDTAKPPSNSNSTAVSLLDPAKLPATNRFDTQARRDNPFDESGLGIAVNTVKNLPGAAVHVAGDIVHSIFRSIGKTGLSILQAANTQIFKSDKFDEALNIDPSKDFMGRLLFGNEKLRPLANEIADKEIEIKNSPFAQKFGLDKGALPLAFAGSILSTSLDLTSFTGGEKGAVEELVKTTDAKGILKILARLGVSDEIAQKAAPELVAITDKTEMGDALNIIKHAESLNKVSIAEDALKTTAPAVKALPDNLPPSQQELDSFASVEQRAAQDWEQNYNGNYQSLFDKAGELKKELDAAVSERDKGMIQGEINHLFTQQKNLEDNFVNKWRTEAGLPPEEVIRKPGVLTADEYAAKQQAEFRAQNEPPFPSDENIPPTVSKQIEETLQRTKKYTQTPAETLKDVAGGETSSLKPIVQQVQKTVKDKVHALDYFATPEFVLKKLGLEEASNALHDGWDAYKIQVKQELQKVINWQKEVGDIPEASQNIFKWLDGQDVKLAPQEQKVAEEMKTYLSQWADKLQLPEDKRIASYITHIFEKDFIQKEFDPDLAKLIVDKIPGSVYDPFLQERLGKSGYKEDVFAALDAYVKRATRKVNMDGPLGLLKEQGKNLDLESYNYVQRLASRINLRPTEMDNLIDNFIKSTVGYKYGQRPLTEISQKIRTMIYRGTLGLNFGSALRNLTQGVNTYAKLGEKYTVVGYTKLFGRMLTNNLDELVERGILNDDIIQDQKLGVYKSILQKLDTGLFKMFEVAEKINRGSAYFGAKAKAIAGGATEEEAIQVAKKLVRETQFAFGNIDSPVALSSDLMKTIFQLQSFNIKQVEFLKNMIKNKEFGGLVRFTVGSLGVVYTIGRLFGMSPSDLIPTVRIGGSPLGTALSTLAGLVSPNAQTRAQAKAKIGANIATLIPAGVQIRKTFQGIKAVNQGKDTTATGRTRYNIPQTVTNYLRAGIFGKNTLPQAKEYFNSIGQPAAKTSGTSRFTPKAKAKSTSKSGNRFSQ